MMLLVYVAIVPQEGRYDVGPVTAS